MSEHCLQIDALRYTWPKAAKPTLIIPHFHLSSAERVFLQGDSGSGKSTLLNLISGVLSPDSGQIQLLGQAFSEQSAKQRDHLRAEHIGYIFQQFNLLPYLSVIDNVLLPCRVSARRRQRAKAQSDSLEQLALSHLNALGLPPAIAQRPVTELSIGQQQRVAAARALIGAPELIIADEPTSALDTRHRERFIELLLEQCQAHGSSLLFVSHDPHLKSAFHRSVDLHTLNEAYDDVLA